MQKAARSDKLKYNRITQHIVVKERFKVSAKASATDALTRDEISSAIDIALTAKHGGCRHCLDYQRLSLDSQGGCRNID